jgi:hypothetical protein
MIFHLPPLTCVSAKLTKVSIKEGSIFSFKGISKVVVVLSFRLQDINHAGEDGKQANP